MKMLAEKEIKKLITIDIPQWLDGATNYTSFVLALIRKADPMNRRELATLFPNEVEAFIRWERIQYALDQMPEVGAIVEAGKAFGDVEAGMLGVVYERYDRAHFDSDKDDNVGVGILFETGFYDGFSKQDLKMCDVRHTGKVDEITRYYQFEYVGQLTEDFNRGLFDYALGVKERETRKPRQNISLTEDDFIALVSGGEVVKKPVGGSGVDAHIILRDIGFDRMLAGVDRAMGEK